MKNIAVRDLVSGMEGRLVPNSEKRGSIPGTVDLQITPKGFFGAFQKVWIKGIPIEGGKTNPIPPPDASLYGVEPQVIYILEYSSLEKMQNAIITKLKIFSDSSIENLRKMLEIEKMSSSHMKAIAEDKAKGVNEELKSIKKSGDILSKDTKSDEKRRGGRSMHNPDFGEEYS